MPACDGAVLLEGRAQFLRGIHGRAMADIFIGIDRDVALARADHVRRDLILEAARLLRGLGLVLRGGGELVLLLAADLPFLGDVLGRDPIW